MARWQLSYLPSPVATKIIEATALEFFVFLENLAFPFMQPNATEGWRDHDDHDSSFPPPAAPNVLLFVTHILEVCSHSFLDFFISGWIKLHGDVIHLGDPHHHVPHSQDNRSSTMVCWRWLALASYFVPLCMHGFAITPVTTTTTTTVAIHVCC